MEGTLIASGLQFPEGPVWLDGTLYFTEIEGGVISRWNGDAVERVATTGGGPNGAALGPDGALYVTQNGGMDRASRTTAGIQRVALGDGDVTMVGSSVDGVALEGPNDLAFGPDGRLWFTDPRGAADAARNQRPGRLFVLDVTTGEGELVIELGPVFPNGIAFLADGTLLWTESFTRRVCRLVDGRPEVVIELPDRHFPDGLCIGADGRLYVASTFAHCVSVIDGDVIVDRYLLTDRSGRKTSDGMVTNCCFGGTDLYVTESRRHTLWRFPVGVDGLPLR